MKRICIDLDGVICSLRRTGETYADLRPMPGVVEKIRQLRENGYYIIIHTARHMKTCNSNVGMVLRNIGETTIKWLSDNQIEYDEIYFGKPWADLYIDDNAVRFISWDSICGDGSNLPLSCETQKNHNSQLGIL